MNAGQKQRAAELVSEWNTHYPEYVGDRMAALLQELIDAPEVLAATNPAQISSSDAPPAPAEANDTMNMSRDCEHGQLARSCSICDLERELKAVTEQRDKLLAALVEVIQISDRDHDAWSHVKAVIAEVKGGQQG